MRDLASRLRAIVAADHARRTVAVSAVGPGIDGAIGAAGLQSLADALGGAWHESLSGGACLAIDRSWDPWRSHGRRRIHDYVITESAPVGLFDRRIPTMPAWASKLVFFDIETTGLSGGAGMLPFLAGCGWFNEDGFTVRQFLLAGPTGERALLEQLAQVFAETSLLVTFNGRTFDVPTMEMRWAFHREPTPTDDLPHLDMLPVARRLWGFRGGSRGHAEPKDSTGCSLVALEQSVLGFYRPADVPGCEIPARFFHFMRTGDASAIEDVLEHNRHDLVSLAVLTAHALWLAQSGPDACRGPIELVGLGRCYQRAGDDDRAEQAFARAALSDEPMIRSHALALLAEVQQRAGRSDEAAASWQRLLDEGPADRLAWATHERRAVEALAIYHEHRAKDPTAARRFAESLRGAVSGASLRRRNEVAHRIARLDRKIARADPRELRPNNKGGRLAAPLLDSSDWSTEPTS